jgi:protein tyrosine phosphatase (PTP) superfamily phosphohydrolase (DUF442 family)
MPVEDIKNYLHIGDRLGTAGQPTEDQVRELAAAGYQTVVNLGLLDPKYCLPDEAGLVAGLGMQYHHIPVKFDQPRVADFERFAAVMDASTERKTFVHCALNYRVTAFTALYGQLRLGWSPEQARAWASQLWTPNETWQTFIADCRRKLGLDG